MVELAKALVVVIATSRIVITGDISREVWVLVFEGRSLLGNRSSAQGVFFLGQLFRQLHYFESVPVGISLPMLHMITKG